MNKFIKFEHSEWSLIPSWFNLMKFVFQVEIFNINRVQITWTSAADSESRNYFGDVSTFPEIFLVFSLFPCSLAHKTCLNTLAIPAWRWGETNRVRKNDEHRLKKSRAVDSPFKRLLAKPWNLGVTNLWMFTSWNCVHFVGVLNDSSTTVFEYPKFMGF